MDVLEQRVIDQGLVVPAAGLVDQLSKVFEYRVVEANRDLCLSQIGCHYGPALGT